MELHNIGKGNDDIRACFCVGKQVGCTCGGCRCTCTCTGLDLKNSKENSIFKSWTKALEDYRKNG